MFTAEGLLVGDGLKINCSAHIHYSGGTLTQCKSVARSGSISFVYTDYTSFVVVFLG